ncbi:MAG TPA: hypothetical protein VFJ51_04045 [Nitrososphaeraceae archaeon]|nr:hypothetical protein [Nitrososphaeraceae archaeon]
MSRWNTELPEPSGEFEALDIFANKIKEKYLDVGMAIHGTGIGYSYQLYGYCNKQCYY